MKTITVRYFAMFREHAGLDEETLTLFAVQKQSETNTAADLPTHPIVRKWWAHMAPLMDVNPDDSPVCHELMEVFHLP